MNDFLIMYNNTVHSSTKKKPSEIKNCDDSEIINEVNLNIIKSMSRKLDKYNKMDEYQKLLLTDNIKLKDDVISISKKNQKIIFVFHVDL